MLSMAKLLIGSFLVLVALALVVVGILAFFHIFLTAIYPDVPGWFVFLLSLAVAVPIGWLGAAILMSREIV